MKLAEYLARRRRAIVAAVMLFALIMGFVSAAPPVVTGCQAQDLTSAPDTSMLSPAVSALAQEQQEPAPETPAPQMTRSGGAALALARDNGWGRA